MARRWPAVLFLTIGAFVSLTPGRARATCIGDCDSNCAVTIDEIVTAVNIVLGAKPLSACPAIEAGGDEPTIYEIIAAVNNALLGCTADTCQSTCGNGLVEGDEECDDGGICIGGMNAGTACASDTQCFGNGVCDSGSKPGYACAADGDCPDGRCVRCKPFGGNGCATNCTLESDIVMQLVPGIVDSTGITAGTSGSVVYGDVLTLPFPLGGNQLLTVGKERDGMVPVVIRARSVRFAPAPLSTLGAIGCLCWRGVAAKTCGGALFETDGTQSPDCTPGFTAGDSVCDGKKRCTAVYGEGNSAAGIIGCDGLSDISVKVTQDAGGSSGAPRPRVVRFSDPGGPGSAVLLSSAALGNKGDNNCSSPSPAYGPDQVFCTDDDPPGSSFLGVAFPMPLVTATASGEILDAIGLGSESHGPFSVGGAPFNCAALQRGDIGGAALAGASITEFLGNGVVTVRLVTQPGGS